jgi:K+:H+ antiporter subunit KhtU
VILAAAAGEDAALVFVEIGAVALGLAVLARVAGRLGITAIPFYLLAGLAVGEGGIAPLDVSAEFISLTAEIGVLLLLLVLGLEYTADELRHGLRSGLVPGGVDAAVNFTPGLGAGLLLGWDLTTAVLLGGVCWISSSGVVAKVLSDLDRLGNRETPAVLNVLVIEDLAMAAYLPVVAALVAGRGLADTAVTVSIALAAVALVLVVALRWGERLSALLAAGSDEALLLAVFGLTLLVGGLAQEVQVSAAIGAFLVGLALSGPVQARAGALVEPLRDLFAAIFFLFFSFQIDPGDLPAVVLPAAALAVVTGAGKLVSGHAASRPLGVGPRGRLRAGTALIARGEFSIVIASLGAATDHGDELGALAAAYVLLTAVAGPVVAKYADRLPLPGSRAPARAPAPAPSPAASSDGRGLS